ncbi:hypothetical protein OC861_005500 [Tilletia horrida]|nr:hypothetical protein OC861_005500 [Tilletia horrida]
MRFTPLTAFLTLAGIATAALPECSPPEKAGILLPARNATVRVGKPFQFYFCSAQYFRTHTISIDVVLTSTKGALTNGTLVSAGLTPKPADESGYLYNITIPSGYQQRGKAYLGVFERASGYYAPTYTTTSLLVNVVS